MAKVRPNDPCPCGSGKKYKKCCGAAGGANVANPEAILDAAFRYLNQGRFTDAVKQAQKLVNGGISHPDVFGVLGMAYYQLGKLDEAERAMQQVTRLVPRSADAFANLGLVQFEGGKYQAAVASCGKALELDPSNAPAYNNLGNVFLKLGSYAEAEKNYRKALEFEPEGVLAQSNLGFALSKQGRHEEAIDVLQPLVERHPDFAGAQARLAEALLSEGRMNEAFESIERSAVLEPDNPEFVKLRGDCLALQGKREDAVKEYNHALKIAPKYGDAYIALADLHAAVPDVAYQYFAKALRVEPDNPRALVHAGIGLLEQGHYERATEMLNRALEIDPASPLAYAGLGHAAVRQFQFNQAEREINRAIQLAPHDPYVIEAHARLLAARGEVAHAISVWKDFLNSSPDNVAALMGLAECYSEGEKWDRAAETFARAADVSSDAPSILAAWAVFEEKRNNLDQAVKLAAKAIDGGGPEVASAYRVLARAARRRGNLEEALVALERAESLSQDGFAKFDLASTLFEKGAVLDKSGRYAEAFDAYEAANQLNAEAFGSKYEGAHDWAQIRMEVFSRPEVRGLAPIDTDAPGPQPIFVVGFPRSGTTLMEQVLAAHHDVVAAGELPFIASIARDVGKRLLNASTEYPHFLEELSRNGRQDDLRLLRDYYIEQAHEAVGTSAAQWFVDKMPLNLNHLGLIRLLFPRSPIIHMLRHPLDSCLSAFMSSFSQGHAYANRIDTAARHFARTANLALWYRDNLDLNYLAVRYEDVVAEQENKTREVLDFIGLPWDENCLRFYESKRVARTASYAQVTQKMYTSSRFRYKNYYDRLKPVFPIVEGVVRDYGYTIEPPGSE